MLNLALGHNLRECKMPIEFSYFLFSLLLTAYAMWRYFIQRERGLFYISLGFTFLTTSTILQLVESLIWVYVNITTLRLLKLSGLALFTCFAVLVVLALKEISKKPNEHFKHSKL